MEDYGLSRFLRERKLERNFLLIHVVIWVNIWDNTLNTECSLHCWEVLKGSPKWMETGVLKFLSNPKTRKGCKTSGSSSFNRESVDASINLNVDVGDNEEDEVQEVRQPMGREKAKCLKKKGPRSSRSS
nr:hypothetical protein [Tanacetum cinerariifolium]